MRLLDRSAKWLKALGAIGILIILAPLTPARAQNITLSGVATQGTGMGAATVTAYAINPATGANGATLGSATTDANGNFSITLASAPNGPVRLLATGGTFTSVQDETTITSRNLISALLANVTDSQSGISLNPLTKLVNNRTGGMISHPSGAPPSMATALANATAEIERDYGLKSDPATLMPDYSVTGIGTDAGNLALILGGFINLDEHMCPPPTHQPGGLVSVLANDLADGVYDGAMFGTPLTYCGVPLPAIAGISQFQDALSGLQQLQLIPQAFSFGGAGNLLTKSGITAQQLLPGLATINTAIASAAPPSVNSFAGPDDTAETKGIIGLPSLAHLTNGRVFVPGSNSTTGQLASTQLYDATKNAFVFGPLMDQPRTYGTAMLLPNGKVLVAGGTEDTTTELYDPTTRTLVPGPAMNSMHLSAVATLMGNGKVLIAGGQGQGGAVTTEVDIYDPTTNSFAPPASTPHMNVARMWSGAALLANGQVLIAGGCNTFALNSTEIYDPSANTFASNPPQLSDARKLPTVTALANGQVLIAGGINNSNVPLTSSDIYSTSMNSIAPGPAMATGRWDAANALLPNDRVLVASTEIFDPTGLSFSAGPAVNVPRQGAGSALLRTGKVLLIGGVYIVGDPLSTELYTP
jgi:hypothetical protein